MRLSEEGELNRIFNFLHRLGATANYTGFFYAAYGTLLCMKEPRRLTPVSYTHLDVYKRQPSLRKRKRSKALRNLWSITGPDWQLRKPRLRL